MRLAVLRAFCAGFGIVLAGIAPLLHGCGNDQQQAQAQPTPSLAEREQAILNNPKISAAQKEARLKIERAKDRDAAAMAARAKNSTP